MPVPYGTYSVEYSCEYEHKTSITATFSSTVEFTRGRDENSYPSNIYDHVEHVVKSDIQRRGIDTSTATIDIDFDSLSKESTLS